MPLMMIKLKKLDKIAYIRFASVYQDFDIDKLKIIYFKCIIFNTFIIFIKEIRLIHFIK
jgi:hypothetical protein